MGWRAETEENQITPPKTSGMAVASLVFAFIFPLLGLALGIVALIQTSNNRLLRGHGISIAGIIVSVVWPLLVTYGVLIPARETARRVSCMGNLEQIATAISMYQSDWSLMYPSISGPGREFERVWPDANKPFPANLRTRSSGGGAALGPGPLSAILPNGRLDVSISYRKNKMEDPRRDHRIL